MGIIFGWVSGVGAMASKAFAWAQSSGRHSVETVVGIATFSRHRACPSGVHWDGSHLFGHLVLDGIASVVGRFFG